MSTMEDEFYTLTEQRLKESEAERKAARERFKFLSIEIRQLQQILVTHGRMERRLPKVTNTSAKRGGRRKEESGDTARPAGPSST